LEACRDALYLYAVDRHAWGKVHSDGRRRRDIRSRGAGGTRKPNWIRILIKVVYMMAKATFVAVSTYSSQKKSAYFGRSGTTSRRRGSRLQIRIACTCCIPEIVHGKIRRASDGLAGTLINGVNQRSGLTVVYTAIIR
jgi:hypothetical protein